MKKHIKILILLFSLFIPHLIAQGNVYIVFGSDTGIWEGMDVAKYNDYYNVNVISDPNRYFYQAMRPEYRNKFSDSYGGNLKLTWWMMGGNLIRYATNKNVPIANSMVPYQVKKHYGDLIGQFGDELTLHYHTFTWTDYDGDGKYWWNQAKNFMECTEDFDFTLAQFLLDEDIFPVSFRSGWNTMDNDWQVWLEKYLPFSMHNEAPAYRTSVTEPIDNVYDWRRGSKEFIPYHPQSNDYQVSGNLKGYNVHSMNMGGMTQTLMNTIYDKAASGQDQVVCLWAHVWDDIFLTVPLKIDTLAHNSALTHPTVKFKYCTGAEAMQLWKKTTNFTKPEITITEEPDGDRVKFIIHTDRQIFQTYPFFAIKDVNEKYQVIKCAPMGVNTWRTATSFNKSLLIKIGIALTDTSGNLAKKIINYFPDDSFVDNIDVKYRELKGVWSSNSNASWGLNSRQAVLQGNDTSAAQWDIDIVQPGSYNLFVQIPQAANAASKVEYKIFSGGSLVDSAMFSSALPVMDWVYLNTIHFNSLTGNSIVVSGSGEGQAGKILLADVIKVSPAVRQRALSVFPEFIDFGEVSKLDSATYTLLLINKGSQNLSINSISSVNNLVSVNANFPVVIQKMGKANIIVKFIATTLGIKYDTLKISSDDDQRPNLAVPIIANVNQYFKIVDNEDSQFYSELGTWNFSNAHANGLTSRYAQINQNPGALAKFNYQLQSAGRYGVYFIVPVTSNAANKAFYVIRQGTQILDSIYIDQNINSGKWTLIGNYNLNINLPVEVQVIDNGKSTVANSVLRADAVKLQWIQEPSNISTNKDIPTEYVLEQNYPNPFNPSTSINYSIPEAGFVTLKIFDVLGREVLKLVNEIKPAGKYQVAFNASDFTSGVYFYTINVLEDNKGAGFFSSRKMLLIK